MKVCFKCGLEKGLDSFYKHKAMKDGRLNKCIDCTKKDVRERENKLIDNPDWVEKERERQRDKYKRLNYKEKQKIWDKDKPWKKSNKYKNLYRKFPLDDGYERHHWNYNEDFLEDFFVLTIEQHRFIHKFLVLDLETRIFSTKDGDLLDTKEKHSLFIRGKLIDKFNLDYDKITTKKG